MKIDLFLMMRTIIESSMMAWGFSKILKKRYPLVLIQIVFSIIFCTSNFIGDTVLSQIIQVPYVAKIPLALGGLILVLHTCFYGKWTKKIFALFVVYLGMFMIDILLSLTMILGTEKSVEELSKWYAKKPTVILFAFYGVLLIYFRYLPVIFLKEKENLTWNEQKSFVLIPICQTLMLFGIVCCATITQDERVFFILLVSTLLTCFCAFFLFSSMGMVIKSVKIQEQMWHIEQKQQIQNEYYGIVSDKVHEIKTQQHDAANHIQTIKALLNQGKQRELEQYVSEVEEKFEKVRIKNYCENTIVNSVLCCKVEQAKKQGINFHIDLHIKNTVPYELLDLSSLFSDLIDNAIENSSKAVGEKYICLTDYEVGNLYTLKIINSKNKAKVQTKGERLITSKEDTDKHGYGTQIIRKIVQKYNGEVQFIDEGGIFTVVVLLQEK